MVMSQFIDSSPPICYWLFDFGFLISFALAVWLGFELFKTLSVAGNFFTYSTIQKAQKASAVGAVVWSLTPLIAILPTIGYPTPEWIKKVFNADLVVHNLCSCDWFYRDVPVCWPAHLPLVDVLLVYQITPTWVAILRII